VPAGSRGVIVSSGLVGGVPSGVSTAGFSESDLVVGGAWRSSFSGAGVS
jgi:hypothetical protein